MYDPQLGRFHTVDPKADEVHNFSLTPYHYVSNNPLLFIDPYGEDWFYNNQTGSMVYIKGQSEISEDYAKALYLGDLKNWEHFGADDVFGDHVTLGDNDENLLDKEAIMMSSGLSESFMDEQGYKKVPSQIFKYDHDNPHHYQTGPRSVRITYGEQVIINEKYNYVTKDKEFSGYGESLFFKPEFNYLTGKKTYERLTVSYDVPSMARKIYDDAQKVDKNVKAIGAGEHDYKNYRNPIPSWDYLPKKYNFLLPYKPKQ